MSLVNPHGSPHLLMISADCCCDHMHQLVIWNNKLSNPTESRPAKKTIVPSFLFSGPLYAVILIFWVVFVRDVKRLCKQFGRCLYSKYVVHYIYLHVLQSPGHACMLHRLILLGLQ
jgi:hypothetical protein